MTEGTAPTQNNLIATAGMETHQKAHVYLQNSALRYNKKYPT
jgi:hypothetical protein